MSEPDGPSRDSRPVAAEAGGPGLNRRGFLQMGAAAAGVSAMAAALSPLKDLTGSDLPTLEQFLQKHYKEMTPADKQAALDRISREVKQRYSIDAPVARHIDGPGPVIVSPGQESRSCGCTQSRRRIMVRTPDSTGSQRIQHRRFQVGISIALQISITQIIGQDKDYIGLFARTFHNCPGAGKHYC